MTSRIKYRIVCNHIIKVSKGVWRLLPSELFRVSRFHAWVVLISSNTNILAKVLPYYIDFFRVHINQSWHFQKILSRWSKLFPNSCIPEPLPNSVYFSGFIKMNTDIFTVIIIFRVTIKLLTLSEHKHFQIVTTNTAD